MIAQIKGSITAYQRSAARCCTNALRDDTYLKQNHLSLMSMIYLMLMQYDTQMNNSKTSPFD